MPERPEDTRAAMPHLHNVATDDPKLQEITLPNVGLPRFGMWARFRHRLSAMLFSAAWWIGGDWLVGYAMFTLSKAIERGYRTAQGTPDEAPFDMHFPTL